MTLAQKLKPSVSRHNLLFIAGLAWTTAGGILMWRGLDYEMKHSPHLHVFFSNPDKSFVLHGWPTE